MPQQAKAILDLLNKQISHQHQEQTQYSPQPNTNNIKSGSQMSIKKQQRKIQQELLPQVKLIQSKRHIGSSSFQREKGRMNVQFKGNMGEEQANSTLDALNEMLANQIGNVIPDSLSDVVGENMKLKEKNVYDIFMQQENDIVFLAQEFQKKQKEMKPIFSVVQTFMKKRQDKIIDMLDSSKIFIQRERNLSNKNQLQVLKEINQQKMLKIRQGEIRSKLDALTFNMSRMDDLDIQTGVSKQQKQLKSFIEKRVAQLDFNNYSMNSEKTKIAQNYVKYMNHQRKLFEKRKKQRQQTYEKMEGDREKEIKQAQQMRDIAKKQQILQRIQQKRKKRMKEEADEIQKEKQVEKLLQKLHLKAPLFKRKERQFFNNVTKGQERYRKQKLEEIRQNRKAMSVSEMKIRQQQYISKIAVDKIKRQEQFKMIMQERQNKDKQKPYFKGVTHKRIKELTKEEKLRSYELLEMSKNKISKMKDYETKISKDHKPGIDVKKREEIERVRQADMLKKNKMRKITKHVKDEETGELQEVSYIEKIPTKDLYQEGNRFLEIAKRNIKRKVSVKKQEEEKSKTPVDSSQVLLNSRLSGSRSVKSKSKNLWEIRAKHLNQISNTEIADAKSFEQMKMNFNNIDHKAADRQKTLNQMQMNIDEHLQQKGMLDQYYLESIKQKMRLLD